VDLEVDDVVQHAFDLGVEFLPQAGGADGELFEPVTAGSISKSGPRR
jgi:hypothetical protein